MIKSVTLLAALLAAATATPYHPMQRLGAYAGYHPAARFGFPIPLPQIDIPTPQDLTNGALGIADGAFGTANDVANGAYGIATSPFRHFGGSGGAPKAPPIPSTPSLPPPPAPKPKPIPPPVATSPHKSWYLLLHEWVWTTYVTWSFHGHPLTTGLTWGIECKDLGCQTKTGFVGFKDDHGTPFLKSTGVEAVGSTEHSHDYGKVFCPAGKFMTSMNCKDASCTSMELVCAPLKWGYRAVYDERWGGVWSHDHKRVYCKEGEYIDGIECVGSCTKHFNIFCSKVEGAGSH